MGWRIVGCLLEVCRYYRIVGGVGFGRITSGGMIVGPLAVWEMKWCMGCYIVRS